MMPEYAKQFYARRIRPFGLIRIPEEICKAAGFEVGGYVNIGMENNRLRLFQGKKPVGGAGLIDRLIDIPYFVRKIYIVEIPGLCL